MKEIRIKSSKIQFVLGDITDQSTDAIVNAANSSLMGGGGVDGAIHRRGGPRILEECSRIRRERWPNGLPIGKAVITSGGDLKAKYVIHAVGPIWEGGSQGESKLLHDAYQNSLELAAGRNLGSIALPSISTGAYGYPIEKACDVALRAASEHLWNGKSPKLVVFVLFSKGDYETYLRAAETIF